MDCLHCLQSFLAAAFAAKPFAQCSNRLQLHHDVWLVSLICEYQQHRCTRPGSGVHAEMRAQQSVGVCIGTAASKQLCRTAASIAGSHALLQWAHCASRILRMLSFWCRQWQHRLRAAVRPPADGSSLQCLGYCQTQGAPPCTSLSAWCSASGSACLSRVTACKHGICSKSSSGCA